MAQGYLDNLEKETNFGESGLTGYLAVIEALFIHRINNFPVEKLTSIRSKLANIIYDSIEKDATKWDSYTIRPSRYIHNPKSYYYEAFVDMKKLVEKECNYLIETRKPQGVWDIPWSWFDLGDQYPKEFAISENRWKGYLAICHLRLLRVFGHFS